MDLWASVRANPLFCLGFRPTIRRHWRSSKEKWSIWNILGVWKAQTRAREINRNILKFISESSIYPISAITMF